jgi:hypothetical protein
MVIEFEVTICRGYSTLDIGVRLGAWSRWVRSYGCFVKKVKYKYKYDNTLKRVLLGWNHDMQ